MKINEKIVNDVYSVLDGKYGKLSMGQLSQVSCEIERDIESIAQKYIFDTISKSYKSYKLLNTNEFQIQKATFQFRMGSKVNLPILEIHLLDIRDIEQSFVAEEIEISGVGYYSKCEIYITNILKNQIKKISYVTKSVYLTSYKWLESCIKQNIEAMESDFTKAIYKYIYIAFEQCGKSDLSDRVWLSLFSETDGYYALDSGAIIRILDILKQRKYVSEHSPAYHLSSLLGLQMPFNKSFSKYAINKNDYEEFSLVKASYMSDMSHIYKTEEQMTEGKKYAIYPISSNSKRKLVISFPADIKSEVLPILKSNEKGIADIYESEVDGMGKHIKEIRSSFSRLDKTELGGLIGGVLGGFYRTMS